MPSEEDSEIGLSEAIEYVRAEIAKSITRSGDDVVRFRPGEVKLDLEIAFASSHAGAAGLKVWVLTLGGSKAKSVTNTHRISLSLTPVLPRGDVYLSAEDDEGPAERAKR